MKSKLQRISQEKGEAEFELNIVSAMVIDTENLPSDSICDAIGEKFGNIPAEIPVLPWPAS